MEVLADCMMLVSTDSGDESSTSRGRLLHLIIDQNKQSQLLPFSCCTCRAACCRCARPLLKSLAFPHTLFVTVLLPQWRHLCHDPLKDFVPILPTLRQATHNSILVSHSPRMYAWRLAVPLGTRFPFHPFIPCPVCFTCSAQRVKQVRLLRDPLFWLLTRFLA